MKIYDFLLEKFIEMGFQEQELLGKEEFYELNLSSLEKSGFNPCNSGKVRRNVGIGRIRKYEYRYIRKVYI